MKTFFRTLIAAAAVAAALVSCSKEVNTDDQSSNKKDYSFKFFANVENVGTRATLTPNANETSFTAAWVDEDKMDFYAFGPDANFDEIGYAVWSDQDQAFNAVFEDIDVPTGTYEWLYYGYYPAQESIPFGSPRVQQGNAYNSMFDVMYGETDAITAEFGKDENGDPLVIPMSRLTGIAYFHITGGPDEDVISATLSAEGIAAEIVNIEGGALEIPSEVPSLNEITINFAEGTAPKATNLQLWFNVIPGSYQNVKLTIVTESHIAVLAPTATFTYTAGKLNKAILSNLNWQSCDVAPKGTVLLSEPFTGFAADAVPEAPGSGATVYGNANVTYSCTSGSKIYTTQISAGGDSPEMLVKGGGEFAISGVPTGYNTSLTVIWNSNNTNIKLNYAGETTTGTLVPGTTKQYMALVTVPAGTASVNLGFKNTTNSNGRLDNIQITAGVSNAPAGLSYTVTEFEAVLGEAFEAPELTNPNTLPVTYASSNTDVAEVNAAGEVTIKALGEATITASSEATDDYEAGEASYTITVVSAALTLSEGTTPAKASCAEDATVTFTVTSNVAWSPSIDEDDDDIIKGIETAENVVTVVFNKNEDDTEKTAVIAIIPENEVHSALAKTITVTQEKFDNTDVLTSDLLGVDTYSDWEDISVVSDAVYAGNSTKNSSDDIQMRASTGNQASSGIVSTTSGGYIRKVKITWGTGNDPTNGRTLNIYASNTQYGSVSDLYASGLTPIATLNSKDGTTVYEFTQDYEYVGVRSNYGALYLADIAFTWEAIDPNAPRFGAEIVGDANIAADVTTGTVQVTGNVAWTASVSNGASINPQSGTGVGTITVTMPENTDIQNSKSYVVTVSTTAQVTPNSYELTFTQAPAPDPNKGDGSLEHPYNATEVLGLTTLPTGKVYVTGTIDSISEISTDYGNATYVITDGTSSVTVYRGKYLNNTSFTSANQIAVNDEVIVYGNIGQHDGANQLSQGNYLYSLNGVTTLPTITKTDITDVPAAGVSGATTTVTFANNNGWTPSVTPDGTVVTAASISGNTITYTVAENTSAARSGSIVVTLSRSGFSDVSATITVSQNSSSTATYGTITITRDCFPSGSLAYNTTDIWSATASTGETITGEGDLYSTANQTTLQTKNSGVSTMYHNTVATPGPITKITLTCASGTTRTYTAYMNKSAVITATSGGTSKGTIAPAAGKSASLELNASDDWHYFWLNLAGGSSTLSSIEIEYLVVTE